MYYILSDLKIVLASIVIALPAVKLLTIDYSKIKKRKKEKYE